jgi:SAM-dependent methyltransferase
MKVDFNREKEWWDTKADKEEKDLGDEIINRALRWREIEKHLGGIRTILDIGGGTGAFSIPLAQRGFSVTHVDFSSCVLEIARNKAKGMTNIKFVESNAIKLSEFRDKSFDLVLNMDGAISFCGSDAEKAIQEACRLTKKKLILTVSHRGMMAYVWVSVGFRETGRFVDAVQPMFGTGEWFQDQFPENRILAKGGTQDYFGVFKAFLPTELKAILERNNMNVIRCCGIGSLAFFCGEEMIQKVQEDEKLFGNFLDLCDRFDKEIMPEGPGTRQRAGLIAVAERKNE